MAVMRSRLCKNVRKLRLLVEKNKDQILRIIVSEPFIKTISACLDEVEIEKIETDEGDVWTLWGVPLQESLQLKGAVLETKDGEFVVIEGIL
jgi:hypothetical protein